MTARLHGHKRPIPPPPEDYYRKEVSDIIITEIKSKDPKKKMVKGKKPVLLGLLVIFIIVIAAMGLYYVLPRVEVEFITVYHEGTGGASSGGFINVNTQIRNDGTKNLEDVNVTITVAEMETGDVVASVNENYYNIARSAQKEPHLDFLGDHYRAYRIVLEIVFTVGGKEYNKKYSYDTGSSEAMNLIFKDRIFEWKF